MNFLIRTDASECIGTGHLMRCISLAQMLQASGGNCVFVCRDLPGNMIRYTEEKGFRVCSLQHPLEYSRCDAPILADWEGSNVDDAEKTLRIIKQMQNVHCLIVDHYSLDLRWERLLRPYVGRIMVIDDLADRHHDCDILLDQNLNHDLSHRYDGLVPGACQKLLGPRYALLRNEFIEVRKRLRRRNGMLNHLLIFLGGSDPGNVTKKCLQAACSLNRRDLYIDVVVGASNPHQTEIKELCAALPMVTYHCQVNNIAELMAAADLAIGAGGSTSWERCYLGLPAIVLVLAENQRSGAEALAAVGAAVNMGPCSFVMPEDIAEQLTLMSGDRTLLKEMGRKAQMLMGDTSLPGIQQLLSTIWGKNSACA